MPKRRLDDRTPHTMEWEMGGGGGGKNQISFRSRMRIRLFSATVISRWAFVSAKLPKIIDRQPKMGLPRHRTYGVNTQLS